MTDREKATEFLKRMVVLNDEFEALGEHDTTPETIEKKMEILRKLIALNDEVTKARDEQERNSGSRSDPDNQRKGEQYDTID